MKTGFFIKTAGSNIRKNYRFFIPRILAEAGLLGVFFIIFTLRQDERILELRGGAYLSLTMTIGTAVMLLLSAILMFYTSSFLMKQRKGEFGLYNVLGMEKRHVGRVLFFESLLSSCVAIIGGLCLGVLFYKLFSLLICRLLQAAVVLGFYFINLKDIVLVAGIFILLDLITFLSNRRAIARMKPTELLSAAAAGEKEPRVKCLILVIGILSLGSGYTLAVVIRSPLKALIFFFGAVFLVIIGTYCLFTTGSIFVLKLLKKKENYYYNKRHMPAVSGLLYRMKQNAVGLASICILATGVLVMISTTVSLYAGMEDSLKANYPQQMYLSAYTGDQNSPVPEDVLSDILHNAAEESGLPIASIETQKYLRVSFLREEDRLLMKSEVGDRWNFADVSEFTFITCDMYRHLGGEALDLSGHEVGLCRISTEGSVLKLPSGSLRIGDETYTIKAAPTYFPIASSAMISVSGYGVIVADEAALEEIRQIQAAGYDYPSSYTTRIAVTFADLTRIHELGPLMGEKVFDGLFQYAESIGDQDMGASLDSVWDTRDELLGMYAAFLFLGMLLGFVCLFATALIIYYKQISEGYEDRQRFQIMQKIGMSKEEVKKTINSQILLVFFLPLIAAGIHLAFAFPILEKLLHILLLSSTKLFIICSLVTYGVFVLIYVLIYGATAKTYYKIVN